MQNSRTIGKEEFIGPLARVLAPAFANDPLNRAVRLWKLSLPNDIVITNDQWINFWIPNVTNKIKAGGEIIQAGDWAAAALWFPPGVKKNTFDRNTSPPPLLEYVDRFEEVKKEVLGEKRFFYLNLIGRDPERSEKGVIRALFEPYLEKARQEGIPLWLEATNKHARDVYSHFGFRTVAELAIGKGSLAPNGDKMDGGEGIVVYGMIAEPGKEGTTA